MKRTVRSLTSLVLAVSLTLAGTSQLVKAATPATAVVPVAMDFSQLKTRLAQAQERLKLMKGSGTDTAIVDAQEKRLTRVATLLAIVTATTQTERHQLIRQLPAATGFISRFKRLAAASNSGAPRFEQPDAGGRLFDLCEDEEGWDECASEQDYDDAEILATELQSDVDSGYSEMDDSYGTICVVYPEYCGPTSDGLRLSETPDGSLAARPCGDVLVPACMSDVLGAIGLYATAEAKVSSLWGIASRIFTVTTRVVAAASASAIFFTSVAIIGAAVAINCMYTHYSPSDFVVSEPDLAFTLAGPQLTLVK